MKAGDFVECDSWLDRHGGKAGIVIEVQDVEHCVGAYVLLDNGIQLIRVENLRLVHEAS